MRNLGIAILGVLLLGCQCRAEVPDASVVPVNAAGWPLQTYVVFAGTLGGGANANQHVVAYGITREGWTGYVDKQIQPLLDGPNPPARIVVHAVGPAWARVRDGEPRRDAAGNLMRWFEYDWPLTVAEGRRREDAQGRWPPLPIYLNDFAEAWRSVADGSRSRGFAIETYVYTGMLQTPWLEELRKEDPAAYRERLIEVADFFKQAGFSGMYVDAASSDSLKPTHEGLKILAEINAQHDFFVGVEAYPPAIHDATTGPLPFFLSHGTIRSQHPGFPQGPRRTWQSKLDRKGLIVWHNAWGGGTYRLTPETARQTAATGADIGVSWVRWKQIATQLPPQQLGAF